MPLLDQTHPLMHRSHLSSGRRHPGRLQSEQPADFNRNGWPTSIGMPGRHHRNTQGAGFDSRAWRLPAVAHARVFEVDHPSTSAEKRRRLANLGTDRAHVRFVPVDFDRQMPADGLAQAGFDSSQRAIVIWDGVTNYLQPEAVDAITSRVGGLAEGGQFIFTYIHSGVWHCQVYVSGTRNGCIRYTDLRGFRPLLPA